MTAAPTYKWQFAYDLFGDRVPVVATFELASAVCVKVGTLLALYHGQLIVAADGYGQYIIGIAEQDIDVAPTAGDPCKVAIIAPGMVIKGVAEDTAASISGFYGKTIDMTASDGRIDPDDTSGGGLSVLRTEDLGLTVWCVLTVGACF